MRRSICTHTQNIPIIIIQHSCWYVNGWLDRTWWSGGLHQAPESILVGFLGLNVLPKSNYFPSCITSTSDDQFKTCEAKVASINEREESVGNDLCYRDDKGLAGSKAKSREKISS